MNKKKNNKKRIALLSNTSWYFYNFRKEFISEVVKKDYEVYLICPKDKYSNFLKNYGIKLIPWNLNRESINIYKETKSIIALIKLFNEIKPDIIHNFTMKPSIYGTIASIMTDIKIVVNSITGLGTLFISKNILILCIRFILWPILAILFQSKCSKIIFQNNDDRDKFIKLGLIKKRKSVVIQSSGINTTFFKPKSRKTNKDFIILFPSRIIKQKGFLELFSACQSIWKMGYEFKLYVAGDIDKGNLSSLSKELVLEIKKNKNILFLGHVKNIKKVYEQADIVVLPSWREGLSKSLLEASAMEKPIVTTNVPGCREVITHNHNGIIVNLKDFEDIKKSILYLYENPDKARKLGKNARKSVIKKFDVKIVNKSTLDVYSNLISSKNG